MNIFQRVLIFILFIAPVSAFAQITFDTSDLDDLIGKRISNTQYAMNAMHFMDLGPLIDPSGANLTFDFSAFTFGPPRDFPFDVVGSSAGTPGAGDPLFDTANWVQVQNITNQTWSYYVLDDTGYFLLGNIIIDANIDLDMNGIPDEISVKNDPPDPTYRFPMSDGTTWNQTFVSATQTPVSQSQSESTVAFSVTGWGTLTTPTGSYDAIRLSKLLTVTGAGPLATTHVFLTNEQALANIAVGPAGNVIAASYSTWTESGITGTEVAPSLSFRLFENYPNPFVGSTRIEFELDTPGQALLRVVDLSGRNVAVLKDSWLPAGEHSVVFDAGDLSSGVYFYELGVDGARAVKKFLIVR